MKIPILEPTEGGVRLSGGRSDLGLVPCHGVFSAEPAGFRSVALGILTGLAFLGVFAVWFFVQNMYAAVSRRIFLRDAFTKGARPEIPCFSFWVKRWAKVSLTMFVDRQCFNFCGLLTRGGIIKHYSHYSWCPTSRRKTPMSRHEGHHAFQSDDAQRSQMGVFCVLNSRRFWAGGPLGGTDLAPGLHAICY